MSTIKTTKTRKSVPLYLKGIENAQRRNDCLKLLTVFEQITKQKPVLWSNGIIGFGEYHYKSDRSTQEGNWPITGFSPRKQNITIYVMPGFSAYQDLLEKLGKHKTSVSCLYINKLEDIDIKILKTLIQQSVVQMKKCYQ